MADFSNDFFELSELKNYRLTYEEMETALCQIEQMLNNRPLTYVYMNDLESCLTPKDLLLGQNLLLHSNNQSKILDLSWNINHHCSKINSILDQFWDRWRKEYVVNLHTYIHT